MRRRIRRIRVRVGGRWGGLSGGLSGKEDKSTRVEKEKLRKRVGARVGADHTRRDQQLGPSSKDRALASLGIYFRVL